MHFFEVISTAAFAMIPFIGYLMGIRNFFFYLKIIKPFLKGNTKQVMPKQRIFTPHFYPTGILIRNIFKQRSQNSLQVCFFNVYCPSTPSSLAPNTKTSDTVIVSNEHDFSITKA